MSGSHPGEPRRLYVDGDSPIHRLAAETKLVGTIAFAVAVACTPRHAVAVFVLDAIVVVVYTAVARIRPRLVITRLSVITPFILLALVIPLVSHGERTDVGGVPLSVDGLWASWNVVVKASLGATAAILLSATTALPALLEGMARLHVPRVVVAIVSSMLRHLELLVAQLAHLRTAMVARGHDPRWLWQARPIAASIGSLFVRSYERGERVHAAMAARGFTGTLAAPEGQRAPVVAWVTAVAPATVASAGLAAWVLAR